MDLVEYHMDTGKTLSGKKREKVGGKPGGKRGKARASESESSDSDSSSDSLSSDVEKDGSSSDGDNSDASSLPDDDLEMHIFSSATSPDAFSRIKAAARATSCLISSTRSLRFVLWAYKHAMPKPYSPTHLHVSLLLLRPCPRNPLQGMVRAQMSLVVVAAAVSGQSGLPQRGLRRLQRRRRFGCWCPSTPGSAFVVCYARTCASPRTPGIHTCPCCVCTFSGTLPIWTQLSRPSLPCRPRVCASRRQHLASPPWPSLLRAHSAAPGAFASRGRTPPA